MIIEYEIPNEMQEFVSQIIKFKQSQKPYLYYYQKVQQMKQGYQNLYELIMREFDKYVDQKIIFKNHQQIIQQHQDVYSKIALIKQIFMIMTIQNNNSIEIQLTAVYMNKIKIHQNLIKQKIFPYLLQQRKVGEQLDEIISFICSTIYDNNFQQEFINESIKYYNTLQQIDIIYKQYYIEQNIFKQFRDDHLTQKLQSQLLSTIEQAITQAPIILNNDQYMRMLYELNLVVQSNIFKNKMYEVIFKDLEIIINDENCNETIKKIIDLYEFYKQKIEVVIKNDDKITAALNMAIESAILTKVNKLSEQYSLYFDTLLMKREENKDLSLVNQQLLRGLNLVQYFQAKDIFEHFYTQRLTRRLLLELSLSLELEQQMIQNLKKQCGDQYVRKAEEVIGEMQKTHKFQFEGVNVNLVVISQNSWTLKQDQLPQFFLEKQRNYFLSQNQQEFQKKQLFWLIDCSNCQVKAMNKYNLIVSAVQALILNFFNEKKSYKVAELMQLTGLSKEEIMKNIIPLEKEKILNLDQQAFSVNYNFQSKRDYIKINQMQKIEKKQEIEESTQKLLHDRKYVIDASIVKIMKRDKQHTLQEIINLVLKDLGLPLKMIDIKQQIEILIDKEYLCRDQNDINLFMYLA